MHQEIKTILFIMPNREVYSHNRNKCQSVFTFTYRGRSNVEGSRTVILDRRDVTKVRMTPALTAGFILRKEPFMERFCPFVFLLIWFLLFVVFFFLSANPESRKAEGDL